MTQLTIEELHACSGLCRNQLAGISPRLALLPLLNELILQDNDNLVVSTAVVCTIARLAVLDVRGCEAAVLDGSRHRLLRHVPSFLFSCLRTTAEF